MCVGGVCLAVFLWVPWQQAEHQQATPTQSSSLSVLFTSCLVFGGPLLRNATINGVQPGRPDQTVEMDKVIKAGMHNQRTENEHLQTCLSGYI